MFKHLAFVTASFAIAAPALAVPQPVGSASATTRIVTAASPLAAAIRPATVDADGKLLSLSVPAAVTLERLSDGARLEARLVTAADGTGYRIVPPTGAGASGTYAGIMAVTFDYN